jgi:hypothetical protein
MAQRAQVGGLKRRAGGVRCVDKGKQKWPIGHSRAIMNHPDITKLL